MRLSPVALSSLSSFVLLCACRSDTSASEGGTSQGTTTTSGATTTQISGGTTTGTGGTAGGPPPMPTLMSPSDTAVDVPIESQLCWNPVEDPDGDRVRYRVFLDDIELTEGKVGEPGHEGPCIGPLNFNYEQTYQWQVQAFDPDVPDSQSDRTTAWSFTTEGDGVTHVVFDDDFEDDNGWTVTGDAGSGAWIRGNPVMTNNGAALAQPDDCAGGTNCYFTGQNPDAVVTDEDVSGGSTILTSPEFDLAGATAATVQLSRFFYKSGAETGTLLRVELLTPDQDAPDGYRSFVLDQLETTTETAGANAWTAKEYVACGLPMVAGSRLRITATDLADGIVEGGIDSVTVTSYNNDRLCTGGEDSVCDPQAEVTGCSDGLLCCPQGVFNTGSYRCKPPVNDLDYDNPPANASMPNNGVPGCDAPDLFVERDAVNVEQGMAFFEANDCALLEGCVNAPGWRRLLTFTTETPNRGSKDLTMGVPSNHPDLFHYSQCHQHYHFDGYAVYELLDDTGLVASGHKQAFCLLDWESWAWPGSDGRYSCSNQGISRGFFDDYWASWTGPDGRYDGLDCQWIDITDVEPGTYTLRLSVNPPAQGTALPPLVERNYDNNVLEMEVTIDAPM